MTAISTKKQKEFAILVSTHNFALISCKTIAFEILALDIFDKMWGKLFSYFGKLKYVFIKNVIKLFDVKLQ